MEQGREALPPRPVCSGIWPARVDLCRRTSVSFHPMVGAHDWGWRCCFQAILGPWLVGAVCHLLGHTYSRSVAPKAQVVDCEKWRIMIDPARLIFVAGLHRSGTTPLARAMGAHPQISGLRETGVKEDEGQHLQTVYARANAYGGAGRFSMDPRAHLTEESLLSSPENAAQLLGEWSPYWDLERDYLLEKSPPNLIMGRFLQGLFPGSAFVAVIRHPIVVALSTHKWRRLAARNVRLHTTHYQLVEHWLTAHEIFRQDLSRLQRCHVLRYEHLVSDAENQLAPVNELLGLSTPLDSGALRSTHSDRYAGQWAAMLSGGPLARRSRSLIERDFGDAIRGWGYDVNDLSLPPTGPAVPSAE